MNDKEKAYKLLTENGSADNKVLRALLLENGFSFDDASIAGVFGKAVQVNRYRQMPKDKKPVSVEGSSIITLYREWCADNDHISSDEELAHFTGKTSQAFYAARRRASETGFEFEKNGAGWIVKGRPAPVVSEKTYTESEVKTMMAELLQKFGK